MHLSKTGLIRGASSVALACALALALAACSKEEPPKAVQPAIAPPATPPDAKVGEIRTEPSERAPMPKLDPNAELAGNVESALRATPGLDALAVDVVAAEGAVTMFGTADTRESIDKAGPVASGVPGVKSVQNKIVVVRGS